MDSGGQTGSKGWDGLLSDQASIAHNAKAPGARTSRAPSSCTARVAGSGRPICPSRTACPRTIAAWTCGHAAGDC